MPRRIRDLKARLRATRRRKLFGGPSGRLKYERFDDDTVNLTFLCSGLDLRDGTELQVWAGGDRVLETEVVRGCCEVRLEAVAANSLPDLQRLTDVSVRAGDQILLEGFLRKD